MPSYKFTISVDPKILPKLAGYQLCMVKAVGQAGEDEPTYNVVCSTTDVTATMEVKWEDNYSICGTKELFNEGGVIVNGDSQILAISFSQQYVLPDWTDAPSVQTTSTAPKNGFTFANAMLATPVVWIQPPALTGSAAGTEVKPVAIYVAPNQSIPGTTDLTPQPKAGFYFKKGVKTGTMVSLNKGTSCMVDFTTNQAQHVTYKEDGTWGPVAPDTAS